MCTIQIVLFSRLFLDWFEDNKAFLIEFFFTYSAEKNRSHFIQMFDTWIKWIYAYVFEKLWAELILYALYYFGFFALKLKLNENFFWFTHAAHFFKSIIECSVFDWPNVLAPYKTNEKKSRYFRRTCLSRWTLVTFWLCKIEWKRNRIEYRISTTTTTKKRNICA